MNDPAALFIQALADRSAIEEQRDDRVEEMLETAERIAGGAIATRAAKELPAAIQRLTMRMFWWTSLLAAGAGVALLAIGAAAGYCSIAS